MGQTITSKKSGFTLVELVVASLIFALSIAGLLSALSSLNRPTVESFEEVQATYLGKEILENLKESIDAETWDDAGSPLEPGTTQSLGQILFGGTTFNTSYNVTADASGGRWVNLLITWD